MRGPRFRRLLRVPFQRRESVTREVDDEIRSHLEQRVESLVAQGLSPDAARAEAERRFGTVGGALDGTRRRLHAQAAARQRRMRQRVWFESLRHDLVFAVRQARRAPGHSLMVASVLALGIGASTAVFTVMNAVLLRPLPFPEPDRLAVIWSLDSLGTRAAASPPMWRDWQDANHSFEGIALHNATRAPVVPGTSGGAAVATTVAFVTKNFFDVLQARIIHGRAFSAEDAAAEDPVVVSERFWRGPLGRPERLPVRLTVFGQPRDVIGVLADESAYPADVDLWVGVAYQDSPQPRNVTRQVATGRLAAGRTLAQADQELDAVMGGIREREPDAIYAYGVALESLREHLVGDAQGSIRLVAATGLLLLLIACANAAAANIVRCTARQRELVIRTSLGAGRGRILRQLVSEQLVLAMVSGAIGLWLAHAGTRWLAGAAAGELPRIRELGFDARVVAVAGACILLSAVVAGLAPLVLLRRRALASGMQSQRSTHGRRLGRVLVATQVAVAFTLLAGAALLVESFRVLMARDLGFDTQRVATVNIPLLGPRYEPSQWMPFISELERSVLEVRGVETVGFSTAPPLTESVLAGGVQVEGAPFGDLRFASYRVVSDRYFQAIGLPILEGRGFDARDAPGALPVTVVNRTMAERYWPGESPIGRRLRAADMDGGNAPWLTVIGVVGDARHWGYASDPEPEHYLPYRQKSWATWGMTLVVRSSVALDRVLPAVRARLRTLDPEIPSELRALDAQVGRAVAQWRLPMSIVTAFGVLALALAALGVYTVFAFVVSQRTREIGLRIALGATAGAVLRGTLRDALGVTLAGAAIGSMAAYFLTGFARTLLFEGTPVDVRPLAAAWAVVIVAAVLAAVVPARRASRVDPTEALRLD